MSEEKKLDNHAAIVKAARLYLSSLSIEEINQRITYCKIEPEYVEHLISDIISYDFDNEEFRAAMCLCDRLGIELQIKGE